MANKGGNPNPENRGRPTTQKWYPNQFVSPVDAQGLSRSWPTIPTDLAGIYNKRPANPLGIRHAGGATSKSKAGKSNINEQSKSGGRYGGDNGPR